MADYSCCSAGVLHPDDLCRDAAHNGVVRHILVTTAPAPTTAYRPMAYIMSIQPNASLTMIGLAAPTSTVVGIILNVCFYLYLERKEKKAA